MIRLVHDMSISSIAVCQKHHYSVWTSSLSTATKQLSEPPSCDVVQTQVPICIVRALKHTSLVSAENHILCAVQIKDCDAILEHMEGMLGGFQADLGKVSDEIRALQVQSQTMSTKLKNRRLAENKLGQFVEQMAVSEDIVAGIMDAEVGHMSSCSLVSCL